MSDTPWEWGDSASASARQQRVVTPPADPSYRAFMDHLVSCAGCGFGQVRCSTAEALWRMYIAARS